MIHIADPVNGSTELLKPTSLTYVQWVNDGCDGNWPIISKMLVDDGLQHWWSDFVRLKRGSGILNVWVVNRQFRSTIHKVTYGDVPCHLFGTFK
jgi:hypothetical protein